MHVKLIGVLFCVCTGAVLNARSPMVMQSSSASVAPVAQGVSPSRSELTPAQTFATLSRKSDLDKAQNKLIEALNVTFKALFESSLYKAYKNATNTLKSAQNNQLAAQDAYTKKKIEYLAKPGADQSIVTLEEGLKTNQALLSSYMAALEKARLKSSWDAMQSANAAVAKASAAQNQTFQLLSPSQQAAMRDYDVRYALIQSAYQARLSALALVQK